MTDFAKLDIEEFLEQLASSSPAPGGGGAAGLCGAAASALVSMAANLTLGKTKYENEWPLMEEICKKSEALRRVFIKLMNDDADSFSFYMRVLKMPKETEVEKSARRKAIQDAVKMSTDVPLRMMEACARLEDIAISAAMHGNPNLISDAGAAALFAEAAAKAASYNVQMNLPNISDPVAADSYALRAKDTLNEVISKASEVSQLLGKIFSKCNGKG